MSKQPWVNFQEIRERISLEDVIYQFYNDIDNLTRSGDTLVGPCPVHGGDSARAFRADLSKRIGSASGVWHCFTRCGAQNDGKSGGNAIDFVMMKEKIGVREAALRLKAFFADRFQDGNSHLKEKSDAQGSAASAKTRAAAQATPHVQEEESSKEEDDVAATNPPLDVHLKLKRDHPYLVETRGFSPATVEHFGVGYCSRGIMRGTVCFPIHNREGKLIAYAGRRLKPFDFERWGKWKFPKGFRKELELFNLDCAADYAEDDGLILVEGFFDVLALHEAGYHNVVAAMGCEVSEHQLDILADFSEVLVLFDGDEPGRAGAESVCKHLEGRTRVRMAHLPDGHDPETFGGRGLRWLINGMVMLDCAEVSVRLMQNKAAPEPTEGSTP